MKYMLLVYSSEEAWTKDEWTACTKESTALCHELHAKGQFRGASPLHPVATAKTVRVRDGRPLITAGPFAETVEQLGGYFLIEVADLDEAISIASRLPAAKRGTVEIRPLIELQGLPTEKAHAPADDQKKFMMLCYDDEQVWNAAGKEAHHAAMMQAVAITHRLDAEGQYLSASPLHPGSMATSVRMQGGRRTVTDGPFAETREVLGGYYLLYARDADEVIAIAAKHPGVFVGAVEVRQVYELPALPVN